MKRYRARMAGLFALTAVAVSSVALPARAQTLSLSDLSAQTHFHGIAVDLEDSARLYLATHHGLYLVSPAGMAMRISADTNDYMGFTLHPADPGILYASGHPSSGGNLGFMVSNNGGQRWQRLSDGVRGPVDFHQMDVSKADPQVIYGVFGGLQVSRDGGNTWEMGAALPEGLIDLAASADDVDRLYAATRDGLLDSADAGASWELAHLRRSPATLVQTGYECEVYAFLVGVGLVRTRDPALNWELVSDAFNDGLLLHLAVDPRDPRRLYVITKDQEIFASGDGGASWGLLGAAGDGD